MITTNQPNIMQHLSQVFTAIPFNQMLGLKLDHISKKLVTMNFQMKNELIGNFFHGILHGGVISSVLDMAGGMSVMTAAIHAHPEYTEDEISAVLRKCSTIDLQICYLRPGKGEHFIAKSTIVKRGKKISFTRMELLNEDNKLIATATGTYMIK